MSGFQVNDGRSTPRALWTRWLAASANGMQALSHRLEGKFEDASRTHSSLPAPDPADAHDVLSFAAFGSSQTRNYARALPDRLSGEKSNPARTALFEVLDWPELPRFLSGPTPDGSIKRSPDAISCFDPETETSTEASMLRLRFGAMQSAFEIETAAYVAAFAGLGFAGLACVAFVFNQPKPAPRSTTAAVISQRRAAAPNVRAEVAPDAAAPVVVPLVSPPKSQPAQEQSAAETQARLSFAPNFADFDVLFPAPQTTAPAAAPMSLDRGAEVAVLGLPLTSHPDNAGVVMIKNLPAEATLSAGSRVSSTDWKLAPSDLAGLVVTLPAPPEKPLTTEIEVFDAEGRPAITTRIEFRLLVDAIAPAVPVAINRKERRRSAKRAAIVPLAPSGAVAVPAQPPPSTALSAAPQPKPIKTTVKSVAPSPTVPSLFKWLSPAEAAKPQAGLTSNEEFLMNFGAMPRN